MNPASPTPAPRGRLHARGWVLRTISVLLLAFAVGAVLNRLAASIETREEQAGFFRGLVQGALMPMAMPNLLVGRDVVIYSANNAGVPYKLGYTVGVNACGALFFGFLYWRILRWRRRFQSSLADTSPRL